MADIDERTGRDRDIDPMEGDGVVGGRQGGMGALERSVAPIIAIGAIVLGIVGLLVGFGWLGPEGVTTEPEAATGLLTGHFLNGFVWMLPGVSAAVLAWTLNRPVHRHGGAEGGGYHTVAYIMALVAIVLGVLAVLVGFDLLGQDNLQTDGIMWGFGSLISSAIAAGAHAAPLPVMRTDDDYIVRLVERRVVVPGPMSGTTTTRTEPMR